MPTELSLTRQQACRFVLAHQSLMPPFSLRGKQGIAEFFARVGCIQYDPVNIVGRSPELVLAARVGDFRPEMLYEALYEDRLLIDGFDKMMAIFMRRDWPSFRRTRAIAFASLGHSPEVVAEVFDEVRAAVEAKGPITWEDTGLDRIVDWAWGPTKIGRAALEAMCVRGDLVIHHRDGVRKVYDLAERCIPREVFEAPDPNVTDDEYAEFRVARRIGGIGLLWDKAGDGWLGTREISTKDRRLAIARLVARGDLIKVNVDGVPQSLYMRACDETTLQAALEAASEAEAGGAGEMVALSPLDNLLWDRALVRALFGFDYVWELYKPAAQRQYGHYVLPVLAGERFVARFQPARDGDSGAIVVENWWWEPDVKPTRALRAAAERCVERIAECGGAPGVRFAKGW
jgi:uncharacterized protein YcaQ